jgi:hypothetical protein
MHFTRELIEIIRAIKDENKIRLRWPNKRIIIEPKEDMPEIEFPKLIKKVGNVKGLEIVKSVKQANYLLKAESKFCNVYLDITVDDEILSERIVNDLLRNIQFSRKKNNFKVGEEIKLTIGTKTKYLKKYLESNKELISDKVSAREFEILLVDLKPENSKVFARLNICPNKECSASLKDNVISKLKKKVPVNCPYCNSPIKEDTVNSITFNFTRV